MGTKTLPPRDEKGHFISKEKLAEMAASEDLEAVKDGEPMNAVLAEKLKAAGLTGSKNVTKVDLNALIEESDEDETGEEDDFDEEGLEAGAADAAISADAAELDRPAEDVHAAGEEHPEDMDVPVEEEAYQEEDEDELKAELIKKINSFYRVLDEQNERVLDDLSLSQLEELSVSLYSEWGSVDNLASLHDAAAAQLMELGKAEHPAVTKRIAYVRQRNADYHAVAQRVATALGQDLVINGMQHRAYHEMLETVLVQNGQLYAGITHCLSLFGMSSADMQVELNKETPCISSENMETLLRRLLMLAFGARNWVHTKDAAHKEVVALRQENERLRIEAEAAGKARSEAQAQLTRYVAEQQAKVNPNYVSRFVLASRGGRMIGFHDIIDKESRLRPNTVAIVTELDRAFVFTSRGNARMAMTVMRSWEKKYAKVLDDAGIRVDNFDICEVQLVKA